MSTKKQSDPHQQNLKHVHSGAVSTNSKKPLVMVVKTRRNAQVSVEGKNVSAAEIKRKYAPWSVVNEKEKALVLEISNRNNALWLVASGRQNSLV